jgi:hypothetical protein
MKKLVAILLIPLFLLTTVGVAMTSLYCHGKISKTGFRVKACCKDVNKGGCCKTESKLVKIEDRYVNASNSFGFHNAIHPAIISHTISYILDFKSVSYFISYWDKAPPSPDKPLYILFHSLII